MHKAGVAAAMVSVTMKGSAYGIHRTTKLGYDAAVERTTEELKKEGFGILTTIDVKETLKKKIDVDFARYVILGACNPKLAHQALTGEPDIGLLLPCNVVVAEGADGRTQISALKPSEVFSKLVRAPGVDKVAQEAEERITRALDAVAASTE